MSYPSSRFRLSPIGAAWLIATMAGCSPDNESPLAPEATPIEAATAAPLVFIQISAGTNHSCGVTAENRAYCWGYNGFGELGVGSTDGADHPAPVLVNGGLSFRQVKAGLNFSCGVTLGNQAYCWGSNGRGQLGDGSKTDRSVPVPVAGGRFFRQVSAGEFHTCAVTTANIAFCWGANDSGKLGDGTMTERLTPVRVKSGGRLFQQVVAGYTHTCALGTDALGYCWGGNFNGQLGDGTDTDRLTPVAIRGGRSLRQISAGEVHSCAVTTSNAAYCWGFNRFGQLGIGTAGYSRRVTPTAVVGGLSFTAVFAGGEHSCGITTLKVAYCWGANALGQLGDGTNTRRTTPTAVAGGHRFSRLSTGFFHTCAVTTDERAYCWGDNGGGRLGDGTSAAEQTKPVAVVGPS